MVAYAVCQVFDLPIPLPTSKLNGPMIDTHQHLIEPNRFHYPWLVEVPQLQDTFDLPLYLSKTSDTAISGTIFMEVDVAPEDQAAEAAHFCELADDPSTSLLGVIAGCRPEHDDFAEQVRRLKHPKLVGLRRILHTVDEAIGKSDLFRGNIATLADHNLTFDLCVRPDQLLTAIEIVNAAPQTVFVLDHCGNPPMADKKALANWQEDIAHLADLPNVSCKVSGLVNNLADTTDTITSLRPVVEYVAAHFGPERLLFGGDWPVCLLANTELSSWTSIARTLLSDQSEKVQNAFFTENARRIYHL